MKVELVVLAAVLALGSCSAGPASKYVTPRASGTPVSVMEDNSINKSGFLNIETRDIESTRSRIYALTKQYDGYIFYEKMTKTNAEQYTLDVRIAIGNDSFLDFYNEVRGSGKLLASEIKASTNMYAVRPESSDEINSRLTIGQSKPSTLEIKLIQGPDLGINLKSTFAGFGTLLTLMLPGLLVLVIIAVGGMGLYLLVYMLYAGLIRNVFRKVRDRFK